MRGDNCSLQRQSMLRSVPLHAAYLFLALAGFCPEADDFFSLTAMP